MVQQLTQPVPASAQSSASTLSDAILVDHVRAGDPAAFELIVRRHNQRLFRLARSILRNSSEAEDAAQEAYVRAYEKLGDFIGPDGFASWLGKIVVNEALGRLRKRGRVISFDDYAKDIGEHVETKHIETMMTQQPDPERLAANGELRHLLEVAIDALPDDFRAVFVLRGVEGLSVVETAEVLSIRPETVKTRFHRARLILQAKLNQKFDALMPAAFAFAGGRCDRVTAAVFLRLAPALKAFHSQAKLPSCGRTAMTATQTKPLKGENE